MKIFVGNLSFKVKDADLQSAFEQYGAVTSAKVITDRYTGRSRGFGFVEMEDDESGKKAISELEGAMLDNREMRVSEAHNNPERVGERRN